MNHSVNADEIHPKHPIEFFDGSINQRTQAGDAGAVHEPMEPPARLVDLLDCPFDFLRFGHIEDERGVPRQFRELIRIVLLPDTRVDVVAL